MNQPTVAVVAIIRNGNDFLLVKRAKEPFKDCWGFIGGVGGFEKSADPYEVVKFEVDADIGCDFSGRFFTYQFENIDNPTIVLYFIGEINGDPKINVQLISEWQWVNLEDALKLDLAFEHKTILGMLENENVQD